MVAADLVVVGGGPAGAAAAIVAARAGREVVVVDKATFPRDKFCGDGLTSGALRILEQLGLSPATIPSWTQVDDVVISSPSHFGARFELPSGTGAYAAVARRAELDGAILDLARDAGAKVLDGHGATGAVEHADRVIVTADGIGEIHARYAVAADGMWSPMRKFLGLGTPGYRGESHAFRQYFRNVGPRARSGLHVWFEADLLPGYAWSFPLANGRANVGFGIHRGGRIEVGDMKRLWPDLLERPRIAEVLGPDAEPEAPHRAWPLPARIDRVTLTSRRTMFVGDAAGATDPMSGEGIGQALLTGVLAARAAEAAGPFAHAQAMQQYTAHTRAALVADHRMSMCFLKLLEHRIGADAAVRIAGLTRWTRTNFARWLFEDYPRAMVLTPRRWHAGMFTGPGSYRDAPSTG